MICIYNFLSIKKNMDKAAPQQLYPATSLTFNINLARHPQSPDDPEGQASCSRSSGKPAPQL